MSRWIQEAIKRPGSLREWLYRHRREIRRLTGMDPFTRDGRINLRVLYWLHNKENIAKITSPAHVDRIWHKVHAAINLRNL